MYKYHPTEVLNTAHLNPIEPTILDGDLLFDDHFRTRWALAAIFVGRCTP